VPRRPWMAESGPGEIDRQLRCLAFGVCRPASPVSDDSVAAFAFKRSRFAQQFFETVAFVELHYRMRDR